MNTCRCHSIYYIIFLIYLGGKGSSFKAGGYFSLVFVPADPWRLKQTGVRGEDISLNRKQDLVKSSVWTLDGKHIWAVELEDGRLPPRLSGVKKS